MIKSILSLFAFAQAGKLLVVGSIVLFASTAVIAQQTDSLLLYASFNEHTDKADYANGWDAFGGGGYRLTSGYLGNAIDLRNHGLAEDFWKTENSFLPHITQWMFWPRGNLDYRQGTLELWLSGLTTAEAPLMGFHANQPLAPVMENGIKTKYIQPYVMISNSRIRWLLVSLKGELIEGRVDFANIPGFKRLTENQWSHLAFQWSPEGFSIYMDGRLINSQTLNDDGLALVSQANRSITMGGLIMDELKIWNHPRYGKTFEPEWKGGLRPATACPGLATVQEIVSLPHGLNKPKTINKAIEELNTLSLGKWNLTFDTKTGYLSSLANDNLSSGNASVVAGLLLWKGTDRQDFGAPKLIGSISNTGTTISFQQEWQSGLKVEHSLSTGATGEIYWDTKYINSGTENLWLEALMSIPLAFKATEFFDMSWTQTKLESPRRRDEYVQSLPFVAASDGAIGWGIGLDPHQGVSALIGEWIPSKFDKSFIRQGSRVVLKAGEQQTLRFVLTAFSGEFGVKDGLAGYQNLFPDLYKQRKETSKYSYMGVSQHFRFVYIPELARQYYVGNQWGHLAYHTKGDYLGRDRFWGRTDLADDPSYVHAANNEKNYKTIANMRSTYVARNKETFDSYYTQMRTHDAPNLAAAFIPREVIPGVVFPDDPLIAGQYYMPENLYVNEYKTPIGAMFKEDLKGMMNLVGKYSTGMTNDVAQATPFRFNDEYAKKSPGRAFSIDRGEYLVSAIGSVDRYKVLDSLPVKGKVRTMWSDYGGTSYSTSAYSAVNAIESGEWFYSLGGLQIGLQVGRNLLGEKPMALLTSYGMDEVGSRFTIADFTPERLRDYYRFGFRRIMLAAFQAGYYVDPPMLHGKQWNSEVNPILVESLVNGRKTIPAAKANNPLWIVRGGSEGKDVLVVGNSSTTEQISRVEIMTRYFNQGQRYLWAPYFGGCVAQSIQKQRTELESVKIKAHDLAAYKPIAELIGADATQARALWQGDGLTIRITIDINLNNAGQLRIISPAVYYSLTDVQINGEKVLAQPNQTITLREGESRIEATLQNTTLQFDQAMWSKVLLLINGTANFSMISGKTIYEKGTAAQMNYFLQQYDEEDGIEGNLSALPIYEDEKDIPSGFTGWKINLYKGDTETKTVVLIDSLEKRITIQGATLGEVRRANMLFMRLVDRTYPHIGRFVPLGVNLERVWGNGKPNDPENAWKKIYTSRPKTTAFFEQFSDQKFLSKPILEKAIEHLYIGDNKNFEGRYKIRRSPYLFEPTYEESFVYDYDGVD